ncbi:unnamed protein product [Rodentolepis nana]|uniref:Uncharacterized protein n=1 Tax=Rodentolepis nana TaxID=102285 RepID=A0A0R3TG10_RODNA|nr:unnamed protein product [Rodentolepis nana]
MLVRGSLESGGRDIWFGWLVDRHSLEAVSRSGAVWSNTSRPRRALLLNSSRRFKGLCFTFECGIF